MPLQKPCKKVAVVGGGASGCMAAIAAARGGAEVHLFEKNEKLGKKIYATGNGRCNLTNLHMDASCYHRGLGPAGGEEDVARLLRSFSERDLLLFFRDLGVPVHDRDGYVYPRTDQARTIVRALENEIGARHVRLHLGGAVREIGSKGSGRKGGDYGGRSPGAFCVHWDGAPLESMDFDAVVLCTGGMAGPQYGSDGDGYRLARAFSHRICKPLPALTGLVCDSPCLKRAAGVRCHASVTIEAVREGGARAPGKGQAKGRGAVLAPGPVREEGEVQMTDYGISGIPAMQLSGRAARLLDGGKRLLARVDFLPEYTDASFEEEASRRMAWSRDRMLGDFFLGLVHKKLLDMVLARRGLQAETRARRLGDADIRAIMEDMRDFPLPVTGVRPFAQAQATSGGILLEDVDGDFQSRLAPGLFFAGEILDVDGRCGGYNLQWAFSSGWMAGKRAAYWCKNDSNRADQAPLRTCPGRPGRENTKDPAAGRENHILEDCPAFGGCAQEAPAL